jgi:hypothetical protein
LRTLCALWWVEHTGPVEVRAGDGTAATVVDTLGLGAGVR